jgi:hypothetical protein
MAAYERWRAARQQSTGDAAAPTAEERGIRFDAIEKALAAAATADGDEYDSDFVDPEDYSDDDFQSVDTDDSAYDLSLPEIADAKGPAPRRRRRPPVATAPAPARAPASALTNYDKWNNVGDDEAPPPSPVARGGALPAMRASETDDGGLSFDFSTADPGTNEDLVMLNPLGTDADEAAPGIYRRATPEAAGAAVDAPAPRVLGVCSSSVCSKDATLRCGICKVAKYCSVECQRRDWKAHKATCAPPRTESVGRHMARRPDDDPE